MYWFNLYQAICKTAKTIAKPIIAEQIPKYKIDSVDFEVLTLGTLPPTFQGLVHPSHSLESFLLSRMCIDKQTQSCTQLYNCYPSF